MGVEGGGGKSGEKQLGEVGRRAHSISVPPLIVRAQARGFSSPWTWFNHYLLLRATAEHYAAKERREKAARRGMLAGQGVACFLETARGAPGEWARVRCEADGTITLLLGTHSNGQGHETSFPQVAADRLGLPVEAFRFVQADTRVVDKGKGHGGARSIYQGGAALVAALDDLVAKARTIAARLLQAAQEDLVFAQGSFAAAGDDRRLSLAEIAGAASDPEQMEGMAAPGLSGEAETTLDAITFPNGCHVAEVEIDRETGEIAVTRYCAVDDYGAMVNPLLTEGQLQGGIVQGIGQAIFEHTAYDPDPASSWRAPSWITASLGPPTSPPSRSRSRACRAHRTRWA